MDSKEDYIIEECRHCGNKTKLDIKGKYTEFSDRETDYDWTQTWLLLKCCVCGKMSLGSIYSGEDTRVWTPNNYNDYYDEEYILLYFLQRHIKVKMYQIKLIVPFQLL